MNAEEISRKLGIVFHEHTEIIFAYLFGSASKNAASARDVDIAVFAEISGPPRINWLADLHGDLCAALARNDVDLIHLNASDNIMLLDEIVRGGKVLCDRTGKDAFSMKQESGTTPSISKKSASG